MSSLRTILTLVAMCVGCGQAGAPPLEEPCEPDADFVATLQRQRARALEDTCFRDAEDTSGCAWVAHEYDPAELAPEMGSSDEAILLVDSLPRLTTAMFRYRARLRGYHRVGPDGTIAPAAHTWRLPAALHETLESLRRPYSVPAAWLEPVADALYESYGSILLDDVGHGGFVFATLAEPTSRHPIVLLDGLDFTDFAPELFCAPASDTTVTARLEARTRVVAASLRALIRTSGVRYVSYSAGWSLPVMRTTWDAFCSGEPPSDAVMRERLATFAPIAEVLFATEGVIAAHAGDASENSLDFPFDQRSDVYPNRVRVGFFTALDSGLDALGRGASSELEAWPGPTSADVWLNSGVLRERPFPFNDTPLETIDGFGTSVAPVTSTTTSWITPLALARLIHLRESAHAGAPFDDALVRALLDELTPAACGPGGDERCRFQDPLRHRQIEAARAACAPARRG
ncbi:hypothetical protein [Sandaracinus amylolyticus]|nr:hypothetical protein [Sandaracinus amylolyticus]